MKIRQTKKQDKHCIVRCWDICRYWNINRIKNNEKLCIPLCQTYKPTVISSVSQSLVSLTKDIIWGSVENDFDLRIKACCYSRNLLNPLQLKQPWCQLNEVCGCHGNTRIRCRANVFFHQSQGTGVSNTMLLLKSLFNNRTFLIWPLIDQRHNHQPIRSPIKMVSNSSDLNKER